MLLFFFLFGLALGAVPPSDDHRLKLQRGNCPMFWFSFNGRCYKYISTHLTWADAELHCLSEKANLVSIHSVEEHNFIKDLIKNFDHNQGYTWIGLNDIHKEGGWMWSDGSAVDFVLWGAVPPSDDHRLKLQRGNCPMFWFSFNGSCYKYISTRFTWADAELYCVSQKANLVVIHSVEEHNFIKDLIMNFDHTRGLTWIGLNDIHKEGGWMWSDGSAVDFVLWDAGEPNNHDGLEDCVHINYGPDLKWNDYSCSEKFTFVCEARPACP
ncbi:Ladderlectin Precursor [Larimichthys crocea]|uniref:Ladderlectin n=1 Tax=Larimichthys crocea TaxID=215358 RepID=A0A6G0HSQ4_LARCR|nr:Ladderlectin Precursor [Larimichthys crocea]